MPPAEDVASKRLRESAHDADDSGADSEDEFDYSKARKDLDQYESSTDGSDAEDEEDQVEQRVRTVRQVSKQNVHESGKVKKIELWDFMCHRRLSVDFGTGVTCITGSNGSGKSAVVNALQICLGSSANSTGRAAKLAQFVRDGATGNTKVQVHLINTGPKAYRPEDFGDVIIVERTISRDGVTKSRLLNGNNNKVIADKKKDVEELCDHLGIQADNPCCVLDQEKAKKFLNGSSKDKYDFFLKATDLDTIVKEFDKEKRIMTQTKGEFEKHSLQEQNMKIKLEAAEKEWRNTQEVRNLDSQIQTFENKLAWATVRDVEVESEALADIVKEKKVKLSDAQNRMKEVEDENAKSAQDMDRLKARIASLVEEISGLDNQYEAAKKDLKDQQAPAKKLRTNLTEKQDELERLKTKKKNTESRITTLVKKVADSGKSGDSLNRDLEAKKAELERLRSEPQESMEDVFSEIQDLTSKIAPAQKLLTTAKENADRASRTISDLQSRIDSEEKQLTTAATSAKNERYRKFYTWLPGLMEEIARSKRFRTQPIFIGEHVNLLKPEHSIPVELVIGSTLRSFIVGSIQDEQELRRVAESRHIRAHELNIYIRDMSGVRLDISQGKPARTWTTIVDVLEINHPEVFNILIDMNRIEGIVLAERKEVESNIWLGTPAQSYMPEKIIAVYDQRGDQYQVKHGSRVFESFSRDPRTLRLFSSESGTKIAQSRIAELKDKLKSEKERLGALQTEVNLHQKNLTEFTRRKAELEEKESTFTVRNQKRVSAITTLEQKIDSLTQQVTNLFSGKDSLEIKSQQESLRSIEESIKKLNEDIEEDNKTIRQMEEVYVAPAQQRLKEIQEKLKSKKEENQELQDQVAEFAGNFKPFAHKVEKAKKEVEVVKAEIVTAEEEHKAKLKELAEKESQALQMCDNVKLEVSERTADIRRRLNALRAAREQEQKRALKDGEALDERLVRVKAEYDRAKTNYEIVKADRAEVEKRLKALKKAVKSRKKRYQQFRQAAEAHTKDMFSELLKQKGHDGDVIFDHASGSIDIKWYRKGLQPGTSTQFTQEDSDDEGPTTADGGAFTDTKSLSGGERSITTLALLLALGRNISSPFRVMDEFDVFMDAQSRKIALQQLLTEARSSSRGVSCQYILLSPQEFSTVQEAQDIKKLRIEPNAQEFGVRGSRTSQTVLDSFLTNGK